DPTERRTIRPRGIDLRHIQIGARLEGFTDWQSGAGDARRLLGADRAFPRTSDSHSEAARCADGRAPLRSAGIAVRLSRRGQLGLSLDLRRIQTLRVTRGQPVQRL